METDIYTLNYPSPLGGIILSSEGEYLTGLRFGEENAAHRDPGLPVFKETVRWLDLYFDGGIPDFTPPLRLSATPFQKTVYDILLAIPYGQTTTYGDIAKEIARQRGGRMSAQAVGGAVGRNPISIIIPCHRVVGSDSSLTGYAWGLERKAALLELEKRITDAMQ